MLLLIESGLIVLKDDKENERYIFLNEGEGYTGEAVEKPVIKKKRRSKKKSLNTR
jgi:hypothetical protein